MKSSIRVLFAGLYQFIETNWERFLRYRVEYLAEARERVWKRDSRMETDSSEMLEVQVVGFTEQASPISPLENNLLSIK